MHHAMQQKKEVGDARVGCGEGHRAQGEPEDGPLWWLEPGVVGGGPVFPLHSAEGIRVLGYQCPAMLCSEPDVGWKVGTWGQGL